MFDEDCIASTSSLCVLLALFVLKIKSLNIKSIELRTIIFVSILSSIINSFFSNTIYFLSLDDWEIGAQFIQYIIGDLVGTFIVFYILKFGKRVIISK